MTRTVGIDLGTTYSLVAYVDEKGEAQTIPDSRAPEGMQALLPSVVGLREDGSIAVGWEARSRRVERPTLTISSVKRLMGKGSKEVAAEENYIPFPLNLEDEKIVRIELGGKSWTPPEISALILKELKARAEQFFKEPVTQAVVTVPAYFNDSQRQATKDAGKIAGLEVLRIVNEPTAASLAYGLHKKKQGKIAVYDLGGGTFDISILNLHEGIFEVLATAGDTHLGGDDIDWRLAQKFLQEISDQYGAEITKDSAFRQLVVEEAERAKRALSHRGSHDLKIIDEKRGIRYARAFSRYELAELVRDIVERTIGPCEQAMRDAKLAPAEIDELILVGGSTRMPLVQDIAEKIFQKKPHSELNPDQVVALGAAIQAEILSGEIKNLLLLDVTPLSLGIETFGGVMGKIIDRNATIPARASEIFTTFVDGQTSVDIHILQGERELVKDNRSLGKFQLKGIEPMPAGLPRIEVTFIVDENGLLQVRARDQRTDKEQAIEIKPSYGLNDEQVKTMIQDSYTHAKEDVEARLLIEARNEAEISIRGAEKALAQGAKLIPQAKHKKISEVLVRLKKAVQGTARREIQETRAELEKEALPLAEKLMDQAVKAALKGKKLEAFQVDNPTQKSK